MRKIRIKSPDRQNLVVIETSAVTKGQLIEEITSLELGISTVDINFVDYHSDVTYSLDGAVLPGIDCLLLIVPTKTSQGVDFIDVEALAELGYNDLRSYGSKLNKEHNAEIDLSGKRDDILQAILDYYDSFKSIEDVAYTLGYKASREAQADTGFVFIPCKRDLLLRLLNMDSEQYVVGITSKQLENKYESVLQESKLKD